LGGWFVCSLGGESWDGEKEGEIDEERVGRVMIYSLCQWNHRQTTSVGGSIINFNGELVMSLYRDPGLNLLVIPSV